MDVEHGWMDGMEQGPGGGEVIIGYLTLDPKKELSGAGQYLAVPCMVPPLLGGMNMSEMGNR